jgi:hypothetical protein
MIRPLDALESGRRRYILEIVYIICRCKLISSQREPPASVEDMKTFRARSHI